MSVIRIELGDWLKNASIIGLLKVLSKKENIDNKVLCKNNYIEFNESLLDGFEEEYFRVLIELNEKNLSWYNLVNLKWEIDNILNKEPKKEDLDRINYVIEQFKTKLNSNSYKNGYLLLDDSDELINKQNKLSKIKTSKNQNVENVKEEILEQGKVLKEIIGYLSKPEVKRIIAAKNVMYDVIQPFWTNVSLLLKTNNKEDMYELYKKDFIKTTINYVKKDKSKSKYTCFTCNNKISKFSKPEAYDLTWLVKTGADMSRKSSHFWNFNGDSYICPVCNILYSCLPLGFIMLKGKGIFINNNQSVKALKGSNITKLVDEYKSFEEIEQLSYLNIANSMEQYNINNLDNEFENIQVIKIDGNNSSRPYSFNVLSKKLMYIIYKNKIALNQLIKVRINITDKYRINLYNEVIRRLYDGRNLFDLIAQLLSMQLSEKFKGGYYIYKILEINNSIMGGASMDYKITEKFKNHGLKLRNLYSQNDSVSKLSGITYRLLNALKTKDSAKFMDTLINAYMYMKVEIPTDFVKALNNQDALQGVGYAFLIGLQGLVENKEGNENAN